MHWWEPPTQKQDCDVRMPTPLLHQGCSLKETEKSIDELVSTFPSRTRKAYSKVSTDAG